MMLSTSRYPLEWIRTALIEAGEPIHPSADVTFARIGEFGFTSAIYRIVIDDRSYVAKIPTVAPPMLASNTDASELVTERKATVDPPHAETFRAIHKREIAAYTWFMEQKTKSNDLQMIGRLYAGEESGTGGREGILIMEDFSARISLGVDFVLGYDLHTVLNIVEHIVCYQAASLSSDVEPPLSLLHQSRFAISAHAEHCVRQLPSLSDSHRKQFIAYSQPEQQLSVFTDYAPGEEGLSPVLIHCDLWPYNLLFHRETDNALRLLAIVDWQIASLGVCMLDVASIMAICMDAEERQSHTETVIQFYVAQMLKRRAEFKRPFDITAEKARSAFTRCLKWPALQLVMTLVNNPQLDVMEDENLEDEKKIEGRLSKRLRQLLDDDC